MHINCQSGMDRRFFFRHVTDVRSRSCIHATLELSLPGRATSRAWPASAKARAVLLGPVGKAHKLATRGALAAALLRSLRSLMSQRPRRARWLQFPFRHRLWSSSIAEPNTGVAFRCEPVQLQP